MDTPSEPHYGRCGIHMFDNPERARRPCEVCAENIEFFARAPVATRRPSHHRPATDSQKAWFAATIKLVEGRNKERGMKLP